MLNIPEDHLNLAGPLHSFPITQLNGPGWRWELFVQGCPLRCTTDCLNEDLLDNTIREVVPIQNIVETALHLRNRFQIEGITFLGGEPFGQARILARLAEQLRTHGFSVMTYSGWRYETLIRADNPDWLDLLAQTDLLVDGPFMPQEVSGRILWRGSHNQRILLLRTAHYTIDALNMRAFVSAGVEPRLTVFDPYLGETLEVHWALPHVPIPCQHHHSDSNNLFGDAHLWCPECEAQQLDKPRILKGLIALVENGTLRLYGHQEKPLVTQFLAQWERYVQLRR